MIITIHLYHVFITTYGHTVHRFERFDVFFRHFLGLGMFRGEPGRHELRDFGQEIHRQYQVEAEYPHVD